MQGPGPGSLNAGSLYAGSLIAGRYALARHVESQADYQRWTAADQILGRDVCLYLLPADSPQAAAVVDAGRQAGALQDPRFVRVLDADVDGDLAYVAEDLVPVSESLVGRLTDGPLWAEDARRAIGEAATALARAEARGLHHLALTPHSLYLLDDGQVKVRGVATRAALTGRDHADSAEASRSDAAGLVALLFAALTGRWPQPQHREGMPVLADASAAGLAGAELGADDPLDPALLSDGIPDDLRQLCATLGTDDLPAGPLEVARRLEPWSVVGSAGAGGLAGAAGAAGGSTSGPTGAGIRNEDDNPDDDPDAAGSDAAGQSGAVTAALGTAWSAGRRAAAGAASVAGHKIEELRDRTEARRAESHRRAEEERARRAAQPGIDETLAEAPAARPEAAAPILPGPIEKPSTRSTVLLLAVILVLLLGAAAFAARGLFAPVGTHPPITATPTAPTGSAGPGKATNTSGTAPAPTGSAPVNVPAGEALTPASVAVFNPSGGPDEGSGAAPKAIDGDVTTQWRSRWSTRADWFGRKPGVGLIVDLGKPQPVGSIALTLPAAPQDLQIFVTSAPSMAGVQAVAEKPGSSGQFTVTLARQVTGQYVIVWITKMGQAESPTQFRAMINEIKVTT